MAGDHSGHQGFAVELDDSVLSRQVVGRAFTDCDDALAVDDNGLPTPGGIVTVEQVRILEDEPSHVCSFGQAGQPERRALGPNGGAPSTAWIAGASESASRRAPAGV